jgi:hypothetical protein
VTAVTGVLGWAWRVIATDERSGSGCIKRVDESWEEGSHRPSGLPSLFGRVPQGFIRGAGGFHLGYFRAVPPGRRRGEFGRVRNTLALAVRGAFRDERPYRDH